ncbi:MAG: hypothetical protein ACREKH_19365, partial [Candidatus Rokuibacteriota bacterium]
TDERGKIAVETLRKIAEMTRGEFIQPKKLTDLAKFYERSAQNLVYDLGTVKEEVFRKAEVDRAKIEIPEGDDGSDAADAEEPGERPGPG